MMKRSVVNKAVRDAQSFFAKNHWALPPEPRWDVTDFGLNDFNQYGLVLVNLAEEPEYCEKLMYAKKDQKTPFHYHKKKKEDIIVRTGQMIIRLYDDPAAVEKVRTLYLKVNGKSKEIKSGDMVILSAGERITLNPGIYHEFNPISEECILGEVSTANDDLSDNFFLNPQVGRFSGIEEDEPAEVKLVTD